MTLNEFTSEIAARWDRQYDMQYRRWLVPQINQWRSRLIRNSLEKKPSERNQFVQPIYIPLLYGQINCGNLICTGSYSATLPTLLRIGDTPFEYLGGLDMKSPYRYNDIGTDTYIAAGKTAAFSITYNLIGNVLILQDRKIEAVTGAGIFDEPEQIMEWQCSHMQTGCDWWNEKYPVSGDIANDIKTAIWQALDPTKGILPQKQDQDE